MTCLGLKSRIEYVLGRKIGLEGSRVGQARVEDND